MEGRQPILLVDDDPGDAELILIALKECAAAVDADVACDGASALDYLYRRGTFADRPDGLPIFLLLDLKMPRVSGLELLCHVKTDPQLAQIPVVVFSSSAQPRDIADAYRAGANAYVVKPVAFEEFTVVIARTARFWVGTNHPPVSTGA